MTRRLARSNAIGLFALGLLVSSAAPADEGKEAAAAKSSSEWLKLVDDGQYAQSWTKAADVFQAAVPKETWTQQLGMVRKPLGAVTSRKLKSRTYTTSLPGAPEGEYVVIQYDTDFANKGGAIETVTPMRGKDGQWRVSGYYIR